MINDDNVTKDEYRSMSDEEEDHEYLKAKLAYQKSMSAKRRNLLY